MHQGFRTGRTAGNGDVHRHPGGDRAAILEDDAARRVLNVAKSIVMEVTMLARACGKTSVTNMEPEDLRSLSIAVSEATGIPVAGKDFDFRTAHGIGEPVAD